MVVLKEANSMFWALFLEAGKRYSQKVERPFHISMAALEIPTDHDSLKAKHNNVVAVMVGMDKGEFLVSSLNYKAIYQQPLDLNFYEGEEVTFFLNGEGNVHLTGYVLEDEPDLEGAMFDEEDVGDSDEDESDDEVPQLVYGKGSKRVRSAKDFAPTKKLKWIEDEADEMDSDEDSEDSDMDGTEEMLEFENDDDDDDEEEDDSDDEEEYVPPKKEKQTPKQTPKGDKKSKQDQQQDQQKSGKKDKNKKIKQAEEIKSAPQTPANQSGPEGDASESQKKKKKKKKKNKEQNEESSPQKQQTPQPKQQQQQQKQQTPKKQVLAGGTVMEEMQVGNGPVAKAGRMVHVYYVGKLQKDNRQFDSCTTGKPFRFRLGTNEVIKGWDSGLAGMKVGGKRKLIIPPQQAYGSQRQGGIPPNSTLVFEVELKTIS